MNSSSESVYSFALTVLKTLQSAGFESYFAGGCVRDKCLGVEPKDWDVATAAKPQEVMGLFEKSIPVGEAFGVVRVILSGHEFEVASFREDGDYLDHRRPKSVNWSSSKEDVLRRDFTINGLLFDPFLPEGKQIIDHVGGLRDLKLALIRAIGDPEKRFSEDYLRMLRAIRFSARLDFEIDPGTFQAIQKTAQEITGVSAERIGQEMSRLLSEGGACRGLELLESSGLLQEILPELGKNDALYARALKRFSGLGPIPKSLAWALLLFDVADASEEGTESEPKDRSHRATSAVFRLARQMRLSNADARAITDIIWLSKAFQNWTSIPLAEQKRLIYHPFSELGLQCFEQLPLSEGLLPAILAAKDSWASLPWPKPLITGEHLKNIGLRPGPHFKFILHEIESAQLEGRIHRQEEALSLAQALYAQGSP